MGWEIPIRKALKGLLWYLSVPLALCGFFALLFDPAAFNYSRSWVFIIRLALMAWFFRQVIRFAFFAWKKTHIRTI